MKTLLLAVLASVSFSAFSQSFVVFENGSIITSDKKGFLYDLGHFTYPDKVTLKGGQFFVEENSILVTIDENGLLYRKYEYIPQKVIGRGMNYFVSAEGELYTFDRQGVSRIFEEDAVRGASHFGGNYFLVAGADDSMTPDLYTVNQEGRFQKSTFPMNLTDVVAFGGSYFMNNRGVVYTISSEGIVSPQNGLRVGIINKRGGNYFTDSNGAFFTVAADGMLRMPPVPMAMKVSNISKLGSNYFVDLSGRMFVVDQDGNVFQRTLRDHDFKDARIISL